MNANSTYFIGHDHIACEDYAIGWSNPQSLNGVAIVCDGCSSSPDVDFGARILAKSVEDSLLLFGSEDNIIRDPYIFGKIVINKASEIFSMFMTLHPQALDATLLLAYVRDKKLYAYMYGDGVFVHKTKVGTSATHITLSSGAPDYLSYQLNEKRLAGYNLLEDNKKEVISIVNGKVVDTNITPLQLKPHEPYAMTCDVEEGDIVAVISDGINSFRKSDNTLIPWTDLLDEFTGFKNFEGEFVLRRLSAFKRKCLKEGTTHSDDISIAAIKI